MYSINKLATALFLGSYIQKTVMSDYTTTLYFVLVMYTVHIQETLQAASSGSSRVTLHKTDSMLHLYYKHASVSALKLIWLLVRWLCYRCLCVWPIFSMEFTQCRPHLYQLLWIHRLDILSVYLTIISAMIITS